MTKPSSQQLKLWLTKFLRLAAVVIVALVVVAHFRFDNPQNLTSYQIKNDLRNGDDTYLSVYENITISDNDIHRGSFSENFYSTDTPTPNELVVVDVEPYGDGSIAREAALDEMQASQLQNEDNSLYQTIIHGADLNITQTEDLADTFEHLYEETLPDDIFDGDSNIKNRKIQNRQIIPSRKPTYFGKTPMIAIVIDDMGINQKRTADISSLNYPLTASFLTYGHNIDRQINASVASGQEIMLHAPMEALGKVDNAPDVLTTAMSLTEIKANLQIMLNKIKNIKGINNHMGSKLTQDKERMQAVMEVLKDNELFFLDSKTSAKSIADLTAEEIGVKHASRNVFLDNNNDKDYILKQLDLTERLAQKNGYAIAIGHPKSQTFSALREWLPNLAQRNIRLVHLSRIIDILNN